MARLKFTCPFCSLFCDDLEVSLAGIKFGELTPSCSLALSSLKSTPCLKNKNEVHGIRKPFELARDEACRLLEDAKNPLVYLTGEISCEEQRQAVVFGRYWNAVVDTPGSAGGCSLFQAINRIGWQSANLSDASKAETLLAFTPDILAKFPRLIHPERQNKQIFVIPEDLPEESKGDFPAYFHEKRWQKHQRKVSVQSLFSMSGRSNGVYIMDHEFIRQGEDAIQELFSLMDSSDVAPGWKGMALFQGSNAQGAVDALQSISGYPACVRFSKSAAEFSVRDYALENMVKNSECDLVLFMGYPSDLPGSVLRQLIKIKTILFSSEKPAWEPDIQFPIKRVGMDGAGMVIRTDGMPLHLPELFTSDRPALQALMKSLKRKRGA